MFVVFDLDGTLSDHRHRLHLVTGAVKDYPAYYDRCHLDRPHMPIVRALWMLSVAGSRIEIWTGRTDRVRDLTLSWFSEMSIPHHLLKRMRADGDFTPDTILKKRWLDECDARPDLVFEDRPRMVQFWREQGIMCCDVGGESE